MSTFNFLHVYGHLFSVDNIENHEHHDYQSGRQEAGYNQIFLPVFDPPVLEYGEPNQDPHHHSRHVGRVAHAVAASL